MSISYAGNSCDVDTSAEREFCYAISHAANVDLRHGTKVTMATDYYRMINEMKHYRYEEVYSWDIPDSFVLGHP